MNQVININGRAVERIEYKGSAVTTLPMIDDLHERPSGTARVGKAEGTGPRGRSCFSAIRHLNHTPRRALYKQIMILPLGWRKQGPKKVGRSNLSIN